MVQRVKDKAHQVLASVGVAVAPGTFKTSKSAGWAGGRAGAGRSVSFVPGRCTSLFSLQHCLSLPACWAPRQCMEGCRAVLGWIQPAAKQGPGLAPRPL